MKISVSYRLSSEAAMLVKLLAEAKGVSQTAIIEIALREMSKREGIVVKRGTPTR